MGQNHFAAAAKVYEQAFDYVHAFEAYRKAQQWKDLCHVTVTSKDETLHRQLVEILLTEKIVDDALTWIPKTASHFTSGFTRTYSTISNRSAILQGTEQWSKAANCFIKANDLSNAGEIYERQLLSNPDDVQIVIGYSRVLMELGQFHDALKSYNPWSTRPPLESLKIRIHY